MCVCVVATTGRKLLLAPLKGPAIASYYPGEVEDFLAEGDTYKSQETVNAEKRIIRLKNRGKGAPKKGEGKRSKKKK